MQSSPLESRAHIQQRCSKNLAIPLQTHFLSLLKETRVGEGAFLVNTELISPPQLRNQTVWKTVTCYLVRKYTKCNHIWRQSKWRWVWNVRYEETTDPKRFRCYFTELVRQQINQIPPGSMKVLITKNNSKILHSLWQYRFNFWIFTETKMYQQNPCSSKADNSFRKEINYWGKKRKKFKQHAQAQTINRITES